MTKQVRMMLLGAVAVAFVAGSAVAVRAEEATIKPGDKSHKTTGDHSAKLPKGFEALDLTDAQKTQIADILKQAKEAKTAAGKDEAAIAKIKEDTHTKLLAVLTDEQRAKLAAAEAAAATQKSPKEGKNHKGHDAPKTDAPKTE
ncbi:MAG: hypothetical protein WCJ97_05810 [Phycisphaerae bacterium]